MRADKIAETAHKNAIGMLELIKQEPNAKALGVEAATLAWAGTRRPRAWTGF